MAIIPPLYINAVVSIGLKNDTPNHNTIWIGTGFFVMRKTDNQGNAFPYLVTNKHVLMGHETIVIMMQEIESGKIKEMKAELFDKDKNPLYRIHSNNSIDIAILPLNAQAIISNNLEFPAFDIDENAMSSKELIAKGVNEGSLLYMLGFPLGLVNKESKIPICRLGCVARISDEQIAESNNILVDIQNFPGNSGSPIISRPEFVSVANTPSFNKSVLMGIVHSYIPYQEKLINSQTKQVVEIKSENSGIANMHPVEFIRDIIDTIQPKFIPLDEVEVHNE